jgi:RNA polymerase sigma-70 factor (ECF subfamily)
MKFPPFAFSPSSSPTPLLAAPSLPRIGPSVLSAASHTLDEATLTALYEKHAPSIYSHCRRLLRSASAARDATHEAFARLMSRAPKDLKVDDWLRYLYRISTNICLNQLRAERVQLRARPTLALQRSSGSLESVLTDRAFASALLERCNERDATIAVMHYIDGLSQVEIADTLSITRRTVFNRLRRLEITARELLDKTSAGGGRSTSGDKDR